MRLLQKTDITSEPSVFVAGAMATESAAIGCSNPWHSPRTVKITQRIMNLSETALLQEVVRFVARSLVNQPERERRLLSHFGVAGGLDWGNIVYAICYRNLLQHAPVNCPATQHARTFSNPNNCGNLIEAVLALGDLAPRVNSGEKNSKDLERLFFTQRWATESEVHAVCEYVLTFSHHPFFFRPDFLSPLEELIRLTCFCVYQSRSSYLFENLRSRRSKKDEVDGAVAEIEAIRLGWPAAAYSMPGLITKQSGDKEWVIVPAKFFQQRIRELFEDTPDVFV